MFAIYYLLFTIHRLHCITIFSTVAAPLLMVSEPLMIVLPGFVVNPLVYPPLSVSATGWFRLRFSLKTEAWLWMVSPLIALSHADWSVFA